MRQIAGDVLEAIGGFANVAASDVCMTRLRIVTRDPALVDTDALADARGVLGFVRRGETGIEVVFGPGKVEAVHDEFQALVAEGMAPLSAEVAEADQDPAAPVEDPGAEGASPVPDPRPEAPADAPELAAEPAAPSLPADPAPPITVHIIPGAQRNPLRDAALAQLDAADEDAGAPDSPTGDAAGAPGATDAFDELVSLLSTVDEADDEDLAADDDAEEDEPDLAPDEPELDAPVPSDEPEPDASAPSEPVSVREARLLVINGPNINMLGIREPAIYGHDTYQDLLDTCQRAAAEAGFARCSCFQSNHEGDIVDAIQDAYDTYDGIVINPGAYTHTSVAILDAAKAVALPMVEVHISKVDERESFRQVSYVRAACFETIQGEGIDGYRTAILDLARHIGL